jgi:glycosyltransferase involved in cell wall biosynthesis
MKVLQIVDTEGWAIDTLTKAIVKHNPNIEFKTLYIPPRGVKEHLKEFETNWKEVDIIHFQYWRTCSQLLELYPQIRSKKLVLSHHNEKNLLSEDWKNIDIITVPTMKAFEEINSFYPEEKLRLIPYGIDTKRFYWNDNYPPRETKIGYVGRIKTWKRLKPIAIACQQLGYRLIVMGTADDPTYMDDICKSMKGTDKMNQIIEWHLQEPKDSVRDVFTEMTVYVGNSHDGRETGTLPFLEAMSVGVPILTTPSGTANDICVDGENCVLLQFNNEGTKDWEEKNINDITIKLEELVKSEELRLKIREGGKKLIEQISEERMAKDYAVLYDEVLAIEKYK